MKLTRFQILILCVLVLSSLPASAVKIEPTGLKSSYKHFVFDTIPLNLEEITTAAEKIFTGKCIKIENIENDSQSKLPVVKYTFKITEGIKGVAGNKTISFKQWEPTTRDAGYESGKKYVLFLHGESRIGLTSPVGFLQGQFNVDADDNGNETVKNKINNHGLSRNVKSQKKLLLRDSYRQNLLEEKSEKGESLNYSDFIEIVKSLIENQ